jgi:glycyl-tRNA synthetase
MNQVLDFQSIILTLQDYWKEQGCLIWQPYYSQVGAGTYNPATILRVLGPEPWNVAYVEPSIRPDDGRYGDNPNRMQQHYQLQVILKPDPGNPQELYLQSLVALGIDPAEHDIRFVEDNWESPALGAWGLGWEVWLDGQEITQFTYFQQAGGINLDPVSVEITYGLERIAIALQKVRHFRDIHWNRFLDYGDVNLRGEVEHSTYYFELANVERLHKMYNLFEAEAESALANQMVLPALDYVLKCSHTFNVLDTRGAIGVTERQAFFRRMRELSRSVAEAYVAQRQDMEFPWLDKDTPVIGQKKAVLSAEESYQVAAPSAPAQLVFEIGTEELPVGDFGSVLTQMEKAVPEMLNDLRIGYEEVKILGTPRRLVVSIADLVERQPDQTTIAKGPPVSRAFDAMGQPTKAAQGFARGKGISVDALEQKEIDGGLYIVAEVHEVGRPTIEVLSEALPELVAGISFNKPMRWNASNVAFSRPIRWLLALYGDQVIPFTYAGIDSGRKTRLLRFGEPEEIMVSNPVEYFEKMNEIGILLDPVERKRTIERQVQKLAENVGGKHDPDPALLEEVTGLVEIPHALCGRFDEEHLQLPEEVLISVMKKHQRYFPVHSDDGKLMPYFITVRNGGEEHGEVVVDGNEQVVRARFTDAAFFIKEDEQKKLEDFLPRLSTLTFQFKLGSMLDKSQRIERLVENLLPIVFLDEQETATALRAAHLCKADLVTNMVIEMTSLQGVIGRHYALKSGEDQATAEAIFEHYLPRFARDGSPTAQPGLLIGLADRLDTLTGLFAAGLEPTGAKDPFAQRRAALGLVQNLINWDLDIDLRQCLSLAAENQPIESTPENQKSCLAFIVGRLRTYLIELGIRYDVVDAVLAVQKQNPAGAKRAASELSEWFSRQEWNTILAAYARCVRITRDIVEIYEVDPGLLIEPAEIELIQALKKVEEVEIKAGSVENFLTAFQPLIPTIDRFFEDVLVMAEDEKLRMSRLGLLQRISSLAEGVADLSTVEGF